MMCFFIGLSGRHATEPRLPASRRRRCQARRQEGCRPVNIYTCNMSTVDTLGHDPSHPDMDSWVKPKRNDNDNNQNIKTFTTSILFFASAWSWAAKMAWLPQTVLILEFSQSKIYQIRGDQKNLLTSLLCCHRMSSIQKHHIITLFTKIPNFYSLTHLTD